MKCIKLRNIIAYFLTLAMVAGLWSVNGITALASTAADMEEEQFINEAGLPVNDLAEAVGVPWTAEMQSILESFTAKENSALAVMDYPFPAPMAENSIISCEESTLYSYMVGDGSVNAAASCSGDYGYSTFPAKLQSLYAAWYEKYEQLYENDSYIDYPSGNGKFVIIGSVPWSADEENYTSTEVWSVYFAIKHNHPEFYWMSNYYPVTSTPMLILDQFFAEGEKRQEADTAIEDGISEYLAVASGSDYEQVLAIHDKLIEEVEYAHTPNGPESAIWAHSIAGAFVDYYNVNSLRKGVVCEGYAKTFQLLLNKLDIPNYYVIGDAGGGHAWNYVQLDGNWYPVDATWDDLGDESAGGVFHSYFCIPGNVFSSSHNPYRQASGNAGKWLYDLPELANDRTHTYYSAFSIDYSGSVAGIELGEDLESKSGSCPGTYVETLMGSEAFSALKGIGYPCVAYESTLGGNTVFIHKTYLNSSAYPATEIITEKTSYEVDGSSDVSLSVTASVNSSSDDNIYWVLDDPTAAVLRFSETGENATLLFKKNGIFTLTAKAVKGSAEKAITIKVTGITFNAGDGTVIWINGASVKDKSTGTKKNYKCAEWALGFTASDIHYTDSKGNPKTKSGKIIVGVTSTPATPDISRGKIVDEHAAQIAKVSYSAKNGIKVTAGKSAGEVYVWAIDTGDSGNYSCSRVIVNEAASKITAWDFPIAEEGHRAYKGGGIIVGDKIEVYFTAPVSSKDSRNAENSTFSYSVDEKVKDCVSIKEISKPSGMVYALEITAEQLLASKPGKTASVKITVYCVESNKKCSITLKIGNPPVSYRIEDSTAPALAPEMGPADLQQIHFDYGCCGTSITSTYKVTETLAASGSAATCKSKVAVLEKMEDICCNDKGKLSIKKPTGNLSKVKATYKGGTLTLKVSSKNLPAVDFYVCFYNDYHITSFVKVLCGGSSGGLAY